ncbi:MAG: hypothetical protein IBX70_12975 [Clostridia bacterium]|nr:hypothetical protein [Clostridia bacterium]
MKKVLSLALVGVLAFGAMGMSFAASPFGAAETYANLAGITAEEAYEVKLASGDTFGDLAKEKGFYEAFSAAVLSSKINMINGLVAENELTQAEADALITSLDNCDGTQQHLLKGVLNFGAQARSGEFRGQGAMNGEGSQFNRSENGRGMGQMRRGNNQ